MSKPKDNSKSKKKKYPKNISKKYDYFFCTFPEGGKSIFRPFSRKKGGKEAENNFPTFFPEKGRKIDFPTGRKAEGEGRFLPEATQSHKLDPEKHKLLCVEMYQKLAANTFLK